MFSVVERLHQGLELIGSKLVSMATDSSHRTIMGKTVFSSFLSCFDPILFILACNADEHKSLNELEFWSSQTTEYGVSCP